ncbi:MAG: membrane fusion protein MtrC, partial [Chthoniobacteraceae bacterium]
MILIVLLLILSLDLRAADAPSPAKIANPVKEADLATVTLTPQAEQRLGIKLVAIERRAIANTRTLPGEAVLPLAGAKGGVAPVVGGTLDEVLKLADAQADADGRVETARVQLDGAKVAHDRAQKMLSAEAGSVRSVDEAKTAVQIAESALTTAKERRALLGGEVGNADGARLWIRVPVFIGQVGDLQTDAPARVRILAGGERAPAVSARPVTGPPTASAASATVDFFYQLDAPLPGLRAGARVEIAIPARGESEALVAPWAAVMH